MNDTFMKEKPIFGLVLSMSLPMVLSMLVSSLYNIVDSYFVAKISEDAMTALSLVYPVQNLINAVTIGFGIGINAVIAYYLGAQDRSCADRAAALGVFWNLAHGVILTAASIAVMPFFLRLFSSDEGIMDYALRYSRIAFSFAVVIALGMTYEKIFQAAGRMRSAMISTLAGCITNIILDPVLIFGIGPAPELGIEGAALATGIGQTVTLALYLAICVIRPLPVRIRLKSLFSDGASDKTVFQDEITGKLYAVGIPACLNLALPSILISALNGILAVFSESYVLVLGVYYKLQTFLYLTANGIVQGIRPLVGYNYGAGEHGRVKKIFQTALSMSAVIMVFGTVPGSGAAVRPVYDECGDDPHGRDGPSHHQPGLSGVLGLHHGGRGAGRTGKRSAVAFDFPAALSGADHSCGLSSKPLPGSGGGLACLLGDRVDRGFRRLFDLS